VLERVNVPAVMGNDNGVAPSEPWSLAEFVANARATKPDAWASVERRKVALALDLAAADAHVTGRFGQEFGAQSHESSSQASCRPSIRCGIS
jgi:hypothetical protein